MRRGQRRADHLQNWRQPWCNKPIVHFLLSVGFSTAPQRKAIDPVAVCRPPDQLCWAPDVRWTSSACVDYTTVAAGAFRYVQSPALTAGARLR